MRSIKTQQLQPVTDLATLIVQPHLFTVQDILRMARLLKKAPTEVFESIVYEITLTNSDLIHECEKVADEYLEKKGKLCQN